MYLNQLSFEKDDAKIKDHLISKMDIDFVEFKKDLMDILGKDKKKLNAWVVCDKKCEKIVKSNILKEISSTAFFLKALSESVIGKRMVFKTDVTKLTGIWEDDSKYIQMVCNNGKSRLIMGFGPSSSGKTYWAESIIKLLGQMQPFPTEFITIDGGSYRKSSMIYQITKNSAVESGYYGFSNLVVAGIYNLIRKSLFNSDYIKTEMIKYLSEQSKRNSISLYVPETLGDCGGLLELRKKSCKKKYRPFIEITKDENWIALMIWQHEYKKDCTYSGKYTCFGTTESGLARQVGEGKEYRNDAYKHSIKLGLKHSSKAPGGSISVHNAGQKDHISTIKILSYPKMPEDKLRFEQLQTYQEEFNYNLSFRKRRSRSR